MKYRVENKYLIYEDQIAYIKTKLKEVMDLDSNMKGDSYLIRSIYFDDLYNTCMEENESGVNERQKYRIRAYDYDKAFVRLERKEKTNGFTKKESAIVDSDFADEYINIGTFPGAVLNIEHKMTKDTPILIKELYAQEKLRLMSPVNIVEYERQAFVCKVGNVRITFDKNIGYTTDLSRFWDQNMDTYPILPMGQHILEIKYDELIPDYIKEVLNTGDLQRSAFSKYYYSRVAQMNMG